VSTSASGPSPIGLRKAAAESSRRKLLDAALEHFARRPYDEVAASDITESAGVANGLLFHHFDSKRGIYHEALAEARRALDAACAVDDNAPPGRQIRELLTRHLTYLAENPNLALNVILNRTGPAEATDAFEATRWGVIGWATQALGLDSKTPACESCGGPSAPQQTRPPVAGCAPIAPTPSPTSSRPWSSYWSGRCEGPPGSTQNCGYRAPLRRCGDHNRKRHRPPRGTTRFARARNRHH
jgi:AcrR family transcriptional regulator